MRRIAVLSFLVLLMGFVGLSVAAAQTAQDPAICLKTCMENYGADKKNSCALQCGYGNSTGATGAMNQQKPDCGVQYKRCMNACKAGEKSAKKSCETACREARTSCI